MSPLLLLGLLLTPGDSELPLSPDLDSAARAAVAEVRSILFSVAEPSGAAWTIRLAGAGPTEEVRAAVLAALASDGVAAVAGGKPSGVSLEVGRLAVGGHEALLLRVEAPAAGSVLAPFVRKEWVRGPPLAPEGGGIACKGGSQLEENEERASAAAVAAGAAELRERLVACGISRSGIERLLPEGEAARRFLEDLFVRREGGEAWRAHALFRVEGEEVRSLSREAACLDREARGALRAKFLALLGIAAGAFLVYLWLDFATAGRATGGARLLALGLAAAGAALVL
ncbi:MAG TPA: hypothetical protein VFI25_08775 [Planctomycetota bacterium]|jgi:hypothetical protein|nr:hypothetical protein [Planctomycetota bacterium]